MKARIGFSQGRRGWFGLILVALFFAASPLRAQVDTGAILGTVTDASGAAVTGASVTLTNQGTNAALTTTTAVDGGYKFTPVRIGTYKIKVSLQGFQTVEKRDITVNVGADVVVDFALKPGSVTETIEVFHLPGPTRPWCEFSSGGYSRQCRHWRFRGERSSAGSKQLFARWHR